jgi:cytochrome c553
MRSGARTSAEPRKSNALVMVMLAQAMTEAEMAEAADYFAALKHTPWIRVEETERVPRVASEAGRWVALAHERTEPIGGRIIELAEDEEQFKLLNPRSGFVALVPPGSLKRGEWLVTTGGVGARDGVAKTLACTTCHGPDLLGNDEIPPIAGRSPSYLARQMFDFQAGARRGVAAATMAPVVANLDADDVTAIVAYVSSLPAARR